MLPAELNQKYELRGELGSGAMGVVYDATDRFIGRRVAIKVVQRPKGSGPEQEEAAQRFRREAQAAGRFTHPNIVIVYDYGENADQAWIVMELVEGGSLKDRIDRGERFPMKEVVRVMDEILRALAYAHQHGVAAHRDIKPANIMLTPDGTVKIADFGIARTDNSSMTQLGTMIGTPAYLAPEQFDGAPVDGRVDIWAAGIVLYQLLTGSKPFDGNFNSVMQRVLNTEPIPPSQLSVTVPRPFDAVIARALAKRPDDRFPTAAAFAEAIRAAVNSANVAPVPPPGGYNSDATVVNTGGMGGLPPLPGMGGPSDPGGPPMGGSSGPVAGGGGGGAKSPSTDQASGGGGRGKGLAVALVGLVVLAAGGGTAWYFLGSGQSTTVVGQGPGPTAPVTPTGPSTPVPVVPAGPTVVDFRTAAQAAAQMPCTLLAWSANDQGLALAGVIRRGDEPAIRRSIASRNIPATAVRMQVQAFDGPYCDVLDQVRPVLGALGATPTAMVLGQQPLADNDPLQIDVVMPNWPSHLYVAYFDKEGQVSHLVPSRPMAPGSRHVVGQAEGFRVGPPFGTDLAIVIASEQPLFDPRTARPPQEPQGPYLRALGAAIAQHRANGVRIAVRPVVIETVQRR